MVPGGHQRARITGVRMVPGGHQRGRITRVGVALGVGQRGRVARIGDGLDLGLGNAACRNHLRIDVGLRVCQGGRVTGIHLSQVDGVRCCRAVGDIDHAALVSGATHRDRAGLVGNRALAQGHRVGCGHRGALAQGHCIGRGRVDGGVGADRGAAIGIHPCIAADGGVVGSSGMAVATHGNAMVTAGLRVRADGHAERTGRHAGRVAAAAVGGDVRVGWGTTAAGNAGNRRIQLRDVDRVGGIDAVGDMDHPPNQVAAVGRSTCVKIRCSVAE